MKIRALLLALVAGLSFTPAQAEAEFRRVVAFLEHVGKGRCEFGVDLPRPVVGLQRRVMGEAFPLDRPVRRQPVERLTDDGFAEIVTAGEAEEFAEGGAPLATIGRPAEIAVVVV